jgi:Rps23 Pro-64 3,4-dihydroxylase Tpa1-like proline 4-hydroxylase
MELLHSHTGHATAIKECGKNRNRAAELLKTIMLKDTLTPEEKAEIAERLPAIEYFNTEIKQKRVIEEFKQRLAQEKADTAAEAFAAQEAQPASHAVHIKSRRVQDENTWEARI